MSDLWMGKTVKKVEGKNTLAKGRALNLELVPVAEAESEAEKLSLTAAGCPAGNSPLQIPPRPSQENLVSVLVSMSCPTGQENPARSSSALSRLSRAVAFLLSLIAGTWEARYRSRPCQRVLSVSLSVVWPLVFVAVAAGPGRILPPCCLWRRVVSPGWLMVPVSMLP